MSSLQEKLQFIKGKVAEVCEDVTELSFGCQLKTPKGQIVTFSHQINYKERLKFSIQRQDRGVF